MTSIRPTTRCTVRVLRLALISPCDKIAPPSTLATTVIAASYLLHTPRALISRPLLLFGFGHGRVSLYSYILQYGAGGESGQSLHTIDVAGFADGTARRTSHASQ